MILFLLLLFCLPLNLHCTSSTSWIKGGYWTSRSELPVSQINSGLFTHLTCAFAYLNSSTFTLYINSTYEKSFSSFTNTVKRKNPSVVTLLSIWGGTAIFSSMVNQSSNRKSFIKSSIETARLYGFQGLDLSGVLPSKSTNMTNLGILFDEWRAEVTSEARNSGNSQLLLVMKSHQLPAIDSVTYPIDSMLRNLDWVHVRAYDYYLPSRDNFTGAHSALYSSSSWFNTNDSIREWLKTGFQAKKLVLGLPYHGYAWQLVNPNENAVGAPAAGRAITMDGSMGYKSIKAFIRDYGYGVASLYNDSYDVNFFSSGTNWINFDGAEAITAKVSFAKEKGLLGYNAFQLSNDDKWELSLAAQGQGQDQKNKARLLVIILVTVATIIFLLSIMICYLQRRRRLLKPGGLVVTARRSISKLKHKISTIENLNYDANSLRVFTFTAIQETTDNFSSENKLGEGGYGPVYKGRLPNGQEMAVKRLSRTSHQGLEEFENEVKLTARLQHVNLLPVLGICTQREEKMLIYDYMPNKSLDFYIFDLRRRYLLDWRTRVHIIEGITQGLLYLQEYSNLTIVHRDLKASNILLDYEMNPKISDFGMARAFTKDECEANTGRIVGTYGYVPPEYVRKGIYSMKYDVYSYGVLLLQILGGKRTSCYYGPNESLNLLEYAYGLWKNGEGMEFIDSSLDDSSSAWKLMRCMQVALLCVQENAADRPTMLEILVMLKSETADIKTPKKPAFSVKKDNDEISECMLEANIYSVDDATITQPLLCLVFLIGLCSWCFYSSRFVSLAVIKDLKVLTSGLESALEEEDPEASTGSVIDDKKRQIQNRAHSTLILSLGDSILREISEEKTTLGIWNKVETPCMKKSLAHRLFLKKRLYTFSMREGVTIQDHIDTFNKIILDPEMVENVKICDEDKAFFLLSSLPKSYEGFVDTMLYGRTTLTLEDVKASLSSKEIQKNNELETSNDKKKKKRKCFYCRKEEHYIRDCFEKKKKESQEKSGDAAVASDDGSDGYQSYLWPQTAILKIKMFDGTIRSLHEVRHTPRLKRNLISLGMLDSSGYFFKSKSGGLEIRKGTEIVMKGVKEKGLYVLQGSSVSVQEGISAVSKEDRTKLWHLRLGHISIKGLLELSKQGLLGGDRIQQLEFCENCIFGKSHRSKFHKGEHMSKQVLDYAHTDLWGPAQVPSLSGGRYFMSLIDDYSRNIKMFDGTIRSLHEVRHTPRLKRNLISLGMLDSSGYFFKSKSGGLEIRKGTEIVMKGVKEKGLYVLQGSSVSVQEGISAVSKEDRTKLWHLRLGHISIKGLLELSKQGLLGGDRIQQLEFCENCIFGKSHRSKFHKGEHMSKQVLDYAHTDLWGPAQVPSLSGGRYFMSLIDDYSRNVWIYILKTKDQALEWIYILKTKDQALEKFKVWKSLVENQSGFKLKCLRINNDLEFCSKEFEEYCQKHGIKRHKTVRVTPQQNGLAERMNKTLVDKTRFNRQSGTSKVKVELLTDKGSEKETAFDDERATTESEEHDVSELPQADLQSYQLARDRVRKEVRAPVRYGYADLIAYTLLCADELTIEEPANFSEAMESVHCDKWLKAMQDEMESLQRNQTWTLIPNPGNKRLISCKWIFKRNEGIPDVEPPKYKARLVARGFTQREGVDFNEIFSPVVKHSSIRILLAMVALLDLELEQMDVKTAFLHGNLEEQILMVQPEGFECKDCKPVQTPLGPQFKLSAAPTSEDESQMNEFPYAQAVGSLMYAMVCIRSDIAHAVSVVSRYLSCPGKVHWNAVKWIMRYLKGSSTCGLLYGKTKSDKIEVMKFVDSDFAGDLDRRKSTSGYMFVLNSYLISWKSSLQTVVALSSTEAEFIATTEAVKEATWLKGLLNELWLNQKTVQVFCDNQSAIHLVKNQMYHERTKHIDVKLQFIRDEVEKGTVVVSKIHTSMNPADALIKSLPTAKFEFCVNQMGIWLKSN
ncbi:hypothetical protein KPL71_002780 [Citrus sinensis]|uniref:Uncharacterized protein n=1 Tax=Citrus sinensis TaxID=2711 RepID=A0ACB8P8H7_CITSI|nr:hypothetical protein KPL71_002780 [Citrus sinensis]